MSDSLFSASWYRVAELKPRLRKHIRVHRHDYRDKIWFVLEDVASGRSHRLTPSSYTFIGLMDGKRTVDDLWKALGSMADEGLPTQDEVIRLLGQLHSTDGMICDVPPDGEELFRRYQRHEQMRWKKRLWSPLAIRIPFWDPEIFLNKTYYLVKPLFSWFGILLWLILVITAVFLACVHWQGLTNNVVDRVLTPHNLFVLWLVYPVVKAFHELGHAYAIKHFGGEVHEIGIMLLVLVPVPYVDASAAWGFRDKRQRMLVGGIGVLVELFLGALALLVWINAEPGPIHAVAYNVMLISGVSTLLFNGNPLLRFDGYYVLADAVEIPNLANRSNKYLGYLIQRYFFGVKDAESGTDSKGERMWFFFYGIAAFIYRMLIMFAIILYIAGKFFIVGILLAIWGVTTQILVPFIKSLSFLFTSPRIRDQRGRALTVSITFVALVMLLLLAVPAPSWTRAEGVIWPSEKSQIRAGTDGFVVDILVPEGDQVKTGQQLIRMEDPFISARLEILQADLKELNSQLMSAQVNNRVQTAMIREEISAVTADLQRTQQQSDELIIDSSREGNLIVPKSKDLPGNFVHKGQVVAYVIDPTELLTAKVVVSQNNIGLVREKTKSIEVMAAQWGSDAYQIDNWRLIPGGTNQLPTAALGSAGGGDFSVEPRDNTARTTLERVFEVELKLPKQISNSFFGQRVYVKFNHDFEPVGFQIYRALRQLFLRRFDV